MTNPEPQLPPIPRQIRIEFAARRDREFAATGASTTEEQLLCLQGRQERAETLGEFPAGDGYLNANRDLKVDYSNKRVVGRDTQRTPLANRLPVLVGAGISLIGVLLLGVEWLLSNNHTAALAPTPTVVVEGAGTPTPVPTVPPLAQIKIDGQGLPVVFPVTLQIGDHAWAVTAAGVDAAGGNWRVAQEAGVVNWLPGSIINWCFGLWSDPAGTNRQVLTTIPAGGADLTLRMSSGVARHFQIHPLPPISHLQSAIFAQQQPGITILLLGTPGDTRLLVQGHEVASGAPSEFAGTPTLPVGSLGTPALSPGDTLPPDRPASR